MIKKGLTAMNNQKFAKPNTNAEKLQQETTFLGMGIKPFTVVAIALLAGMTMVYPYALHRLFYPLIYPYVRDYAITAELAGMVVAVVWFFPLFWFEYWFLGKRRRMQEVKAELERRQKENHTPQS
ncbi:hypothetical protein OBV_41380 [Oscillibacter valericigenes Sjm18-20]|nr:hypothetical protein OBV_41380 [Oscillibacter valericigenes Sjm18-20]